MIFDGITVIGLALMVLLVAGWVFYNHYTEKIIRDLLKDVARLERENKRLRRRLSYDNEIKGAFEPMEFIAQAKPVNPVDYETMKKLLGDSNGEIIAMVKTDNNSAVVDFPNSQRPAKKSERVEDVNKGFY